MPWQQISLLPGNEGLSENSYKEKHNNGNSDFPLSLTYLLIQPCDIHSSMKYFKQMMVVFNYRADDQPFLGTSSVSEIRLCWKAKYLGKEGAHGDRDTFFSHIEILFKYQNSSQHSPVTSA